MANKPDGGADQELEATNDEQPDGCLLVFREQKQDAAHQEPDGDEEVVDDADYFVAAANDQLFVPKLQGQWAVSAVFNHAAEDLF